MQTISPGTTCSAPGKVLLAGGYLILDRPHTGSVLALDARFYSRVELCAFTDAAAGAGMLIEVQSPQFRDTRRYEYRPGAPEPLAPRLLPGASNVPKPNRYVEVPLLYGLTLLGELSGANFFDATVAAARAAGWTQPGIVGLRVTLAADNGFYSQAAELQARGWPLSAASLKALPQMLAPRKDESGEFAKTGLGSSATLVTSLLGALLHTFGAIALPAQGDVHNTARKDASLRLLHNLSQLCHCAAQGKVGSGFDVSTATYGSQRYVRFSPTLLAPLLALEPGVRPPADELLRCVGAVDGGSSAWDHTVVPFQLPPGIEVMMADVSCGANTPSMVKKVTAWRKESPGAAKLWEQYASASDAVQLALQSLCSLHKKCADDATWLASVAQCGQVEASAWSTTGEIGSALLEVRQAGLYLRRLLREVSHAAQTPIEPPEQTALLDATIELPGVLMAVVPGAGGNDAVIALILPSDRSGDATRTRARVAAKWLEWPSIAPPPAPSVVCELPVRESKAEAVGHNGVLLEGKAAAFALCRARGDATPRTHPFLRIHTRDELIEFAKMEQRRRRAIAAGIVVAAVLVAAVPLIVRRTR